MQLETHFLAAETVGNIVYFNVLRALEADTKRARAKALSIVTPLLKAMSITQKASELKFIGVAIERETKAPGLLIVLEKGDES